MTGREPLTDTTREAAEVQADLYRRMTPAQKAAKVTALTQAAYLWSLAGMRQRYPQASERELFLRMAALRLGADTVRRVYGWSAPDDV